MYYVILDRSPDDLKLSPVKAPWSGRGKEDSIYFIDLKGLPLDVILSMRRCHVFYDNRAGFSQLFLSPQTQLLKDQGEEMFKDVLKENLGSRPDALKPGSKKPLNLEDLKAQHEALEIDKQPLHSRWKEQRKG